MGKVTIITDSTSDLSKVLLDNNNIKVLPLFVNFKDYSYLDGVNITVPELFEKVKETNVLPKTAAIPPKTFLETFKNEIQNGNEVVFMGIGSKFSGTYQNALNAASEIDDEKIAVIDSCNLSSGIGLLVLKACKYRDQGFNAKQIKEKVEKHVPLVRTQFAIDTLEFLHKGGRCSGTAKLFGTLLKIKPIIRVVNGGMVVAKKPRGKYVVALDVILDYVKHDLGNIDLDNIMITHPMAHNDAIYLREELHKLDLGVDDSHIHETEAGCVVASHCGPRTIGILYILKEEEVLK